MNGMGFLNATPQHDSLGGNSGMRRRVSAKQQQQQQQAKGGGSNNNNTSFLTPPPYMQKQQQQQQQQPMQFPTRRQQATAVPPMYEQAASPAIDSTTSSTARLDMWRRKRAEKLAEFQQQQYHQAGAAPIPQPLPPSNILPPALAPSPSILPPLALAPTPVQPMPAPDYSSSSSASPPQAPAPPIVADLTKLREELVHLVTMQAPKVDLDQRLLPFNQRMQDLDLRLNMCKTQVEQANTSLKSMQLQAGADRRMLLNGVHPDDFKALHQDLSDALTSWLGQTEETITSVLQEFSDRIFCVYAKVLQPCPVLTGPSFLSVGAAAEHLSPGTSVKLCYPQVQTNEGIFARYMSVNSIGEISMAWIPLHNKQNGGELRYVGHFSV